MHNFSAAEWALVAMFLRNNPDPMSQLYAEKCNDNAYFVANPKIANNA